MSDVVSFAYLVRVSKTYEVETSKFLKCIHGAWINGESLCHGASVRRRQITGDTATFLVSREREIIAQVRLNSSVLDCLVRPEVLNLRFEGYHAPKWKPVQAEDLEIKDLNSEPQLILEWKPTEGRKYVDVLNYEIYRSTGRDSIYLASDLVDDNRFPWHSLYLASDLVNDDRFPFHVGEELTVRIDGDRLLVEKAKKTNG